MSERLRHEPEARKRLAGGEDGGAIENHRMCREHPPSSCRRAPEGAQEAFDSGVAITSLFAPFQGAACEDVEGRDVSGGFTTGYFLASLRLDG